MSDLTQILQQIEQGVPNASEKLLPLVYDELRKLAAAWLAGEKPGQTLQATALVHEAYLRLLGDGEHASWDSRAHFFGAAARAMQRILVENARHSQRLKAGGDWNRVTLTDVEPVVTNPGVDVLALDEALQNLEEEHPRKAELVRLRFFGGLTIAEAASALGISNSTADNGWFYAKSGLRVEMTDGEAEPKTGVGKVDLQRFDFRKLSKTGQPNRDEYVFGTEVLMDAGLADITTEFRSD